ncbi:hypothetical protein MTO96_013833 [Rhipicephalus appendiculatus]
MDGRKLLVLFAVAEVFVPLTSPPVFSTAIPDDSFAARTCGTTKFVPYGFLPGHRSNHAAPTDSGTHAWPTVRFRPLCATFQQYKDLQTFKHRLIQKHPTLPFELHLQPASQGVQSSVDGQKQWDQAHKLPDQESKAVQPPAVQAIHTNDPRCALAMATHHWSDQAVQTGAESASLMTARPIPGRPGPSRPRRASPAGLPAILVPTRQSTPRPAIPNGTHT